MAIRVLISLFILASIFTMMVSGQIGGDARSLRSTPAFGAATIEIRGQVVSSDNDLHFGDLIAELCDTGDMNRIADRTSVSGSGEFVFAFVREGMYKVRIALRNGVIVGEQIVNSPGVVRLEIRNPHQSNTLAGSAISLAELKHKVPGKALKEAKEANKALRKRDIPDLIEHLEKAVALDPEFIAARRNLANAFFSTKQYDRAIDAYRELVILDAHSEIGYLGLSAAYMSAYRVEEAEPIARKAVELDPSNELAHYLLGCSLVAQHKNNAEALSHLNKSFRSFPASQLIAARILAQDGHKEEAKSRVQAYLESGDGYARSEAEELLKTLEY